MSSTAPKIAIVGLGHVGLPTVLGFAELGFQVVGADDDPAKARQIAHGRMPFFEPGLDERLRSHLAEGTFARACPRRLRHILSSCPALKHPLLQRERWRAACMSHLRECRVVLPSGGMLVLTTADSVPLSNRATLLGNRGSQSQLLRFESVA